jgi:hypothetical protein
MPRECDTRSRNQATVSRPRVCWFSVNWNNTRNELVGLRTCLTVRRNHCIGLAGWDYRLSGRSGRRQQRQRDVQALAQIDRSVEGVWRVAWSHGSMASPPLPHLKQRNRFLIQAGGEAAGATRRAVQGTGALILGAVCLAAGGANGHGVIWDDLLRLDLSSRIAAHA